MKVKIITGFDQNQKYTIDAEEAHKAYYLFRNPEKRGVFENGIALIGRDIRAIIPDWNATMGWNDTHKLDDDDWNEIRKYSVKEKMNEVLDQANKVSYLVEEKPQLLSMKLSEIEIPALPKNKLDELTDGINKLQ